MEGFDKYLDSLSFVSQRGVLIKHDTDLKTKIAGGSRARREVRERSCPRSVCDVIEQAFVKAERLLGLSDQIDELVERWQKLDEAARADAAKALPLARALFDLVRPPPEAAPDRGDYF